MNLPVNHDLRMAKPYRLGVESLNVLLEYAGEQGLDMGFCLEGSGIGAGVFAEPDATITPEQELHVVQRLVAALGEPFRLGFDVGLRYHFTVLGIMGLGLKSSASAGESAQRGMRFAGTAFSLIDYHMTSSAGAPALRLRLDHLPTGAREFLLARDLGAMRTIHDELIPGAPFGISHVALEMPWQPGMERVRTLFGCPLQTDMPESVLKLNPVTLSQGLRQANQITARQCDVHCEALMEKRQLDPCLVTRVRQILINAELPMPSLDETARRLNVSVRGLRRQLRAEGAQWRRLVDGVVEERARALLASGDFSVQMVAEKLGYAEASSFSHAFKRWTGLSPGHYQRTLKPADASS